MKRAIILPAIAAVFALLAAPVHVAGTVTPSRFFAISGGGHIYTPSVPCGCLAGPSDTVTLTGKTQRAVTQMSSGLHTATRRRPW